MSGSVPSTPPGVHEVPPLRRALVTGFIAIMLVGHAFDIVLERDDWPFSQYGMYNKLQGRTAARQRFVGVTDTGEVPLDVRRQLRPFDPTRLEWAPTRVRRSRSKHEQDAALAALLARYEALRKTGRHDGPPLRGLRVYRYHYRLEPGRGAARPFKRELRLEVLRGQGGGA